MASFDGTRIITAAEYRQQLASRVDPSQTVVGQHYSFMGEFVNPRAAGQEAYTVPMVAVSRPEEWGRGLLAVCFNRVDYDLRPKDGVHRLVFGSDKMLDLTEVVCEEGSEIRSGYVRGYDDGISGGLLSLTTSLEMAEDITNKVPQLA